MSVFSNNIEHPGVYWNSKSCDKINFETDDTWAALTSVDDITDEVINKIQSIGIITYYGDSTDASRASFAFTIPKKNWVIEGYDSQKNYGSIYQWMYFLSYKNIIAPLFDALKIEYLDEYNIWTNTTLNDGDIGGSNAVQWTVDLNHNSGRISYKNGVGIGIEIYTLSDGCPQTALNTEISKADAKLTHGTYYCEGHPNESNTVFFSLRSDSVLENTITPKYIVFNTSSNDNQHLPFWVQIEESNNIPNTTWSESTPKLTKYQWDIFMGHKDLVSKVYDFVNLDNLIEGLDKYGIPDLVWTSTDYMAKENTIGYYEVNKGKGIKWVVCPSLGSSQIVFKKKTECLYPNVGIWE